MNKQIIIQGNNLPEVPPTTELVGASDIKNFNELQQELRTALENKGMNMGFIVDRISYVINEAYQLNNKGDEAPDFKTILEASKLLLKVYGFDLSDKKTQIAVFNNIPPKGEKLNF